MKPRGHRGGVPLWVLGLMLAGALIYVFIERHMFWQILIGMGVAVGSTEGAGSAF